MRVFCALFLVLAVPATIHAEPIRIATWNLEWFFDADPSDDPTGLNFDPAAPSEDEYYSRVKGFADAIAKINPHIMALQEVENKEVVQDIADQLKDEYGLKYTVAFVQGKDSTTKQDVAVLVKDGIPFVARRFTFARHGDSDFKDLSKHLWLSATIDGKPFDFVVVHLITRPAERIRQARTLREWTENMAGGNLVILGDFNVGIRFEETTPDSDIGIIRGFQTEDTDDDLFDAHQKLGNRKTHVSGKELDRVLLSPSLVDLQGLDFQSVENRQDLAIHGNADQGGGVDYDLPEEEQDLSDHFPLVVTLSEARSL